MALLGHSQHPILGLISLCLADRFTLGLYLAFVALTCIAYWHVVCIRPTDVGLRVFTIRVKCRRRRNSEPVSKLHSQQLPDD